jgi:hypothetical protein
MNTMLTRFTIPTQVLVSKPIPPVAPVPEVPSPAPVRAGNLDADFTNAAEAISKMTHPGALEGMLRIYRLELANYQAKKLPIPEFLAGNLAAVEKRLEALGVTVFAELPHPVINPGLTDWAAVIEQVTLPTDDRQTFARKLHEHAKLANTTLPNAITLPTYNKLA